METLQHIFIVNPTAGKANAVAYLEPQIHEAAKKLGLSYKIHRTNGVGHAMEIAAEYAQAGQPVRLYACGGDGTLNEVLKGAYVYHNAQVASVPCGSGNDFVRNFGTAAEFLDLADNLAGTAISLDLMQVDTGISAAITSVGVDANVAYAIPHFRRIPFCGGSTAYNLSIAKALLGRLYRKMSVTLDGVTMEGEYTIVAACNGRSYGGGFCAAPTADLQDGLLEVVLVKKLSRFRIASVLKLYKAGKHITENNTVVSQLADVMEYHTVRQVCVETCDGKDVVVNVDGECAPRPKLEICVLPAAAQFVLPKAVFARRKEAVLVGK